MIFLQEARRIVIAQWQHIVFNEFVPLTVGRSRVRKYGLRLRSSRYWRGTGVLIYLDLVIIKDRHLLEYILSFIFF
jgi:hypothetical protein